MAEQMNPEIKRLWIEALRSDEYEQAQNQLRSVNGSYCCLGVLCEIFRVSTGQGTWIGGVFQVNEKSSMAQLPEPVRLWAGLERRDPLLGRTKSAIALNDSGHSFEFIADRIEKYL